jgi:hypothetical protein
MSGDLIPPDEAARASACLNLVSKILPHPVGSQKHCMPHVFVYRLSAETLNEDKKSIKRSLKNASSWQFGLLHIIGTLTAMGKVGRLAGFARKKCYPENSQD